MSSGAYTETLKQSLKYADSVIDLSKDIKKAKYIKTEFSNHDHKKYDIVKFHRLQGKKAEYIIAENRKGDRYFYKAIGPEVIGSKTPASRPINSIIQPLNHISITQTA